jgi:hypothetical protein
MKFGTLTKKYMPSPKTQNRRSNTIFQDGRRRHVEKPLMDITQPFINRFWWNSVHRLKATYWVEKNRSLEVRRHFSRWPPPPCWKTLEGCISANFDPTLMKFCTQTDNNMLNQKNSTPTVRRHFPRWPPSPCRKILEGCVSANCDAILIKCSTQTKNNMLKPKNSTPTARRHFSRWPPPPC